MEFTREIPEYGDKMLFNDFVEAVESGCFTDYDGHGYLSDGIMMNNKTFYPSDIDELEDKMFENVGITHVIWFNK